MSSELTTRSAGAHTEQPVRRLVFGPDFSVNRETLQAFVFQNVDFVRLECTPEQFAEHYWPNGLAQQPLELCSGERYEDAHRLVLPRGGYPASIYMLFFYCLCYSKSAEPVALNNNFEQLLTAVPADLRADLPAFFGELWPPQGAQHYILAWLAVPGRIENLRFRFPYQL